MMYIATTFHTKKLSSRLFSTEVEIYWGKIAKSRFVPPFGGLGVTYTVHLWLAGKRVVDFLFVLVETLRADIGQKFGV